MKNLILIMSFLVAHRTFAVDDIKCKISKFENNSDKAVQLADESVPDHGFENQNGWKTN